MRLGLIERPVEELNRHTTIMLDRVSDEIGLREVLVRLERNLREVQESSNQKAVSPVNLFKWNKPGVQGSLEVQFTSFGIRFARACGIFNAPPPQKSNPLRVP